MKGRAIAALLLAAAMTLTLTGCPLRSSDSDTASTSTEMGTTAETVDSETVETTDTTAALSTADISKTDMDGVYQSENGMVVLRNVQVGSCSFIIDIEGASGNGYLAGIAEREDSVFTYYESNFSFTMTVSGDTLTVVESGTNGYADSGVSFAGTYTKTDTDPYSIQVDDTKAYGASVLPSSVSKITKGGKTISLYIDPNGRFSATFPAIFDSAPAAEQPEDGVYLVGDVGNAAITICTQATSSQQTPEDFIAYLTGQYPGSTAQQLDSGLIRFDYAFTDGNGTAKTEIIFFYLAETEIYKVDFVFVTSDAASYSALAAQIGIAVN